MEIFLFIKKGLLVPELMLTYCWIIERKNSVKLESKFKPFSFFCCWPDVGPVYQASFRS